MAKEYKHVEIVRSMIPILSSMSLASCQAIYKVLSKRYTDVGVTTINTPADLQLLLDSSPDLVFLGMEFVPKDPALGIYDPNKIWLSDFLDAHDIAYTGSDSRAHELQRNKDLAKQRILDSGFSTSAFQVVGQDQLFTNDDLQLPFPLFIKPLNRGGGLGIDSGSVVNDFRQLSDRINFIRALGSGSLIEQYLTGREFSVAILKDSLLNKYTALPIELVAPVNEYGDRILSSAIKSSNAERPIEVTNEELKTRLCQFGLDAFNALGARDYGRIDIRLDDKGIPQFLEANLLPSLISDYGSFPRACVINLGLQYEDMINQIVDLAFERKPTVIEAVIDNKIIDTDLYSATDILLEAV